MDVRICSCGLIKQSKAGVTVTDSGSRICNNCGRPADVADLMDAEVLAGILPIPASRITTLHELPGCRVTAVLGVVSELTSASGWTAASKGNSALSSAMQGLNRTAKAMGANAVVGLSATTFGAHGGITAGFGGDAVGVLLLGTAVVVEADAGDKAVQADPAPGS